MLYNNPVQKKHAIVMSRTNVPGKSLIN